MNPKKTKFRKGALKKATFLREVKEIMTKNVLTVKPDQALNEAARIMKKNNIGSLVVVEENEIVGIITERDFLETIAKQKKPTLFVKDSMTKPVVNCTPDTSVEMAFRLMKEKQIRHLPVVKDGKLIGILSSRELGWISIIDVATLFNRLFIDYCKATGKILETGAAMFTPRFIEELITLYEERRFALTSKDLAATLIETATQELKKKERTSEEKM